MAVSDDFKQNWLECQEEYGKNIEAGDIEVLELDRIDKAVTLPAVKFTRDYDPDGDNQFESYVHVPMATFRKPIDDLAAEVSTATGDLTELKAQTAAARDAANDAADRVDDAIDAAETATAYAERVNATMDGMVITVTDRNGISVTKNIGFDMVGTYASIALMNADAANVDEGKFVIIATDDPTAADNAKLYVRNANLPGSQNPFSFCADLDQASAAAWADWLENMKPQIEARIATADADHLQAVGDHGTASEDHTQAVSDSGRAATDHTQAVSDHGTASEDHTQAVSDSGRASDDHTQAVSDSSQAADDHAQAVLDTTRAGQDHSTATQDHSTATQDHSTATQDHGTASDDHTASVNATSDANTAASLANTKASYAQTQGDYAKNLADHPAYIADGTAQKPGDLNFWYIWDYANQAYVKDAYAKGDNLNYEDMTPAEKQDLIDRVKADLVFATTETCESIITELI